MPCLQKNGAVTPQYRQRLCPAAQGRFFSCRIRSVGRAVVSKNHRPLVRIRPHENPNFLQTENRQRISTLAVFLWARVDYASRASKKAPQGLFSPSSATGPQLFESTRLASGKVITKQKLQYPVRILEFLVGAGGFEPPKLKSSRFTVCPHWPLGNTPRFCSRPLPDDLFILSDCGRFVNYFFRIFAAFLQKLSAGSVLGQMFPALVIPQGGNGFAGHGV